MGLFDAFKRRNSVYDEIDETETKAESSAQGRVSSSRMFQSSSPTPVHGAIKMQMLRPTEFSDSPKVADCLKAGQVVVLNLEDMDDTDAKRMIDYIAGVLYAVNGKIERSAQRTFLLTPSGVSVASEDGGRAPVNSYK